MAAWDIPLLNVISIHALLAESDIFSVPQFTNFMYFYPRSPCGERRRVYEGTRKDGTISIHALLAESDDDCGGIHGLDVISIHALLAESDCRLATRISRSFYFYPRSPCGERRHGRR